MEKSKLRVALVHDFLVQYGGAERVLEALSELYPEAPIYTLLYDEKKMHKKFQKKEIRTSFLQKLPFFLRKHYRILMPFFPVAAETLDLRDFDLVISSSGAWSKGVVTRLNTRHVAYLHSPIRFAWEDRENYLNQTVKSGLLKFGVRIFLNYLRLWDWTATDRPDFLLVNSQYTKDRVEKYYRRNSEICYPPVGDYTTIFDKEKNEEIKKRFPEGFFIMVSRLVKYKNLEPVIEAFNKLELPLVVIGEGREEKKLKKIAGKKVEILGWQSDECLGAWYLNARALVFPSVEDFGLAPAEALCAGVPVIGLYQGGMKEMLKPGKNGEFFDAVTPEVIADAVRRFREKEKEYNRSEIRASAKVFSCENFKEKFSQKINEQQ